MARKVNQVKLVKKSQSIACKTKYIRVKLFNERELKIL